MRNALFNSSLLLVALIYGLLLRLVLSLGLLGLALMILLLLSLWTYGYAVLRNIAQGKKELPPPNAESVSPLSEWRLLVHFGFFALALILFATTPLLGDGLPAVWLRSIGAAVLIIVFPASAALMGFTRSPPAALNPSSIAGVIGTFGLGYVKLAAACAGLILFAWFAPAVLAPSGNFVVPLLCDVAAVWAFLGMFALIGGALHERRAHFDIPGVREGEEEWQQRERERARQKTLDRGYGSIRSGLVGEGYRMIKELVKSENDSIEIYQWMFNSMLAWEDQVHALRFGGRFIERLLEADREQSALELADQCRRLWPEFALPAQSAERLARYARSIGRHGAADDLAALSPRVPNP